MSEPWFEEVAAAAGVDFVYSTGHRNRYLMPEIKGGGVGLLDYDRDGLLDIFCVQGGALESPPPTNVSHKLFRNLGGWQFQDVTEAAGVGGNGMYGMGCACADFDNDGNTDIHVTHVGGSQLFRNNGDGTFSDVTEALGLTEGAWGVCSAFFDYDLDGRLDLVIANYLVWSLNAEVECYSRGGLPDYCSPLSYNAPAVDSLYHQETDGRFKLVTRFAGLDRAFGNGLGVVCADFNRDGWLDIFIANDASPNQLWMNQGDGTFVDEALLRGCAVNSMGMSEADMGISTADLNNDGWRDLFVTHLVGEANRLFMNTNGYFLDFVTEQGPGIKSWPVTSFGLGFFDFDHDGLYDLYVANGRVKRGPTDLNPVDLYAEPDHLFRGVGPAQYETIPQAGTPGVVPAAGRGAAFGDLDNDGDIDIVVVNRDQPLRLLKNVVPKAGHWISLRILAGLGRDALGAEVRLEGGDRMWWRTVAPHESYASSNDPRVHCGLGDLDGVERAVVHWPDGQEESFGPLTVDHQHELRQGHGEGRRVEP